tara:strand:- start:440 stop:631 length:192 start_codon:yes stop_codon:yes gene_type:complete
MSKGMARGGKKSKMNTKGGARGGMMMGGKMAMERDEKEREVRSKGGPVYGSTVETAMPKATPC